MPDHLNQSPAGAKMLDLIAYRGLDFVSGQNATLRDTRGRSFTDLASAHGVAAIGHCHPSLQKAIGEQSGRLLSCPGSFGTPLRQELATELRQLMPAGLNRFFFTNSGSESLEAALKMAILSSDRKKIIAFRGGFHGRTLGALGLTFTPKYREPFIPFVPEVDFLPFNDIEALRTAMDTSVCAVVLEVVQGEGGVIPASTTFLRELESLCRRFGCLLIADEVQTGGGRTGTFWAVEASGITPDILCFAKALGGGFPFGGIACSERIRPRPGSHGSTFGGNPLACAAALASLMVIQEEQLCRKAQEKGDMVMAMLRKEDMPDVAEIRGRGLMIGIELKYKVTPVLSRLQERGVIALAAGPRVLRLLPPLTIPKDQLRDAVEIIIDILKKTV